MIDRRTALQAAIGAVAGACLPAKEYIACAVPKEAKSTGGFGFAAQHIAKGCTGPVATIDGAVHTVSNPLADIQCGQVVVFITARDGSKHIVIAEIHA